MAPNKAGQDQHRNLTRREAAADVAIVLGSSALYVAASSAGVRIGWIMPVVLVVLVAYAWLVLRRRDATWHDYGVRGDNLVAAALPVGAVTLVAALMIVAWAGSRRQPLWHSELAVTLPLYPLWGVVQQFVFQGLLHRGLRVLLRHEFLALFANAAAFGMVHVDDWRLALLTCGAGLAWSWCYQCRPNIWLLGLSHGVLAALAYPLLLGDNPVERIW